ncbi:MAG TPA: hypothetical protein VFS67_17940 [Polyangiaceae bacterium]|nr:hypothetical protein [Polyangiaceae bacterium]
MQPALAAIWLSVVLGAALGIGQRWAPRVTDPIRTFAVVAATLVVSLSLLPHALACEGIAGLLGAGLGYAAIPALERVGLLLFRRADPEAMRLELGYSGLLLHRFGDGVAMSVDGHGYGVLWALGAHEIPIVALVTLAFARRGLRTALLRAAALGLSSSLGYWLVSALPAATWHNLHGWADAIAAGVLVHIVGHEGLAERGAHRVGAPLLHPPRRSVAQRALDLGAGLLACVLVLALDGDDGPGATDLLRRLLRLALELSPWLCLGLAGRALLELRSEASSSRRPRLRAALQQGVVQLAGWTVLGLLAATYAAAVQAGPAGLLSTPARLGWSLVAAALAYACAPAAAPLAAVLVAQGVPGAAAAGLLLLAPLARTLAVPASPRGRAPALVSALGAATLAIAVLWDRCGSTAWSALLPDPAQWVLLLGLAACVALDLWRNGVRDWPHASAPGAAGAGGGEHVHAWPGHPQAPR